MAIEKSITAETKDVGPIREKKNKRFSYKPNTVSNGHDPYPNVIPIGPIPHDQILFLMVMILIQTSFQLVQFPMNGHGG